VDGAHFSRFFAKRLSRHKKAPRRGPQGRKNAIKKKRKKKLFLSVFSRSPGPKKKHANAPTSRTRRTLPRILYVALIELPEL
jgi:hypothetical protein